MTRTSGSDNGNCAIERASRPEPRPDTSDEPDDRTTDAAPLVGLSPADTERDGRDGRSEGYTHKFLEDTDKFRYRRLG